MTNTTTRPDPQPAMELIHETFGTGQYAQQVRRYSFPDGPPIVTRCTMVPGKWRIDAQVLQPDGTTEIVVSEDIEPRADNGEEDADRLAALAHRMITEARR